MLFDNSHKLRHESLEMKNNFRAHPDPVLIKRRPFDNIGLQRIVNLGYKFECQRLENSGRGNAMREQVVELGSDLENPCRGVLFHDLLRNLTNQGFPIRGRDWCFVRDFLTVVDPVSTSEA